MINNKMTNSTEPTDKYIPPLPFNNSIFIAFTSFLKFRVLALVNFDLSIASISFNRTLIESARLLLIFDSMFSLMNLAIIVFASLHRLSNHDCY
jgi:hypothetical protein